MNYIIDKNLKNLKNKSEKILNYKDLNYKGVTKDIHDYIELSRGTPILNEYKMWLQSKSSDYIRNFGFGGFLRETIYRYPINKNSEEEIKKIIELETKEKFPNIILLRLDVEGLPLSRSWKIKVAVQDALTKMVSYDMYPLKQSIVMEGQN